MMFSMLLNGRVFYRTGIHRDALHSLKQLPEGYTIHTHHLHQFSGQLLDTFEGHLRHAGMVLMQQPKTLLMIDLTTGSVQDQPCKPDWEFAEKLHGGGIGHYLQSLTKLRAFATVGTVSVDQTQLLVLDELDKTVVRARVTVLSHEERHATWLATEPLRGYDEELGLYAEALVAEGFEGYRAGIDYYPMIGIGIPPYNAKPAVDFGWDTPVYDSAVAIARTFLDVARCNEAGILADRDTEFLHDFRVSLRKVRSLLSLFQNVFGDKDYQRTKSELAEIMRHTNRLRDLDVYLMDRDNFFALVPESMHAGIKTLFDIYASERKEAYDSVVAFMQDKAYRERMDDLQRFFNVPGAMTRGGCAEETSGHFARRLILKRYGKVARIARSIHSDTPDEIVHKLRIECKKLRYLMEFFAPLFPQDAIKVLVKSLKGLQDVLGLFNDCSVQRYSLTKFLEEHPLRGKKGIMLAESVGALVATLYQMQLRVRLEIDASLDTFTHYTTGKDFKQLFALGDAE